MITWNKYGMQRIVRFAGNLLMAAGALLLIVLYTPVVSWVAIPLSSSWTSVDQGVLIILGGSTVAYAGVAYSGTPPPRSLIGFSSYWRTIHAIHVWRAGHFRNILITGADSAETIKPLLISNGVPESVILVENEARNTHENAILSKPILAGLPGPYVLLTSDYHMFRASHCFTHENISVETLPAPDLFKRCNFTLQRWDAFCDLARELTSIAYYRARQWI